MKLQSIAHILALVIMALPMLAHAEPRAVILDRFDQALDQQAVKVASIVPEAARSQSCEDRYARIWAQNRLRIDWYYGYLQSETDDVVSDRLMRYTTAHSLMKPCATNVSACGFEKVADLTDDNGPVILEKKLADGRAVEIRLWNSTNKDWNSENTVGFGKVFVTNPAQKRKSHTVYKAFLKSFSEAPVVIYDGHSEFGKGPSFGPMSVGSFIIDFLGNGPRLRKEMKDLKAQGQAPEVFVLAACQSTKYYLPKFRQNFPQTAIVSNDHDQEFAVGEQTVFGLVDSVIAGRCQAGIEQALTPSMGPDAGAHIYGFEL